MEQYENLTLDEERALYGIHDAQVTGCVFDGPADGESALKESGRLFIGDCDFRLRYPLWHVEKAELLNSKMADTCRAAMWYDEGMTLRGCTLNGIKALRECKNTEIQNCQVNSPEFGWFCRGLKVRGSTIFSEYLFLQSRDMEIHRLTMRGKYSFQYIENAIIENSCLDTKDAFWHSKNVTVTDSTIKGEYLGWYSENLKLVRCKIIGTQPLCYAKGLVLEDCEMIDTDLSFENSEVTATVRGEILSVKNPKAGRIEADRIGEILVEESQAADCVIVSRKGREVETEQ